MNELISKNTYSMAPTKDILLSTLSRLDAKTIQNIFGMGCGAVIVCFGIACYSGCEIVVSKNGLSIKKSCAA